MSDARTGPPVHLQYTSSRLWKGELEFTSRRGAQPVATVHITQITGSTDALRVDWNGRSIALMERGPFSAWLRNSPGNLSSVPPFTADEVTWIWRGKALHVTLIEIEHLFPAIALFDLRMLAVR